MKILVILFSGLLIFACGGGGDSSDGPTQIPNRAPIPELLGVVTVLEGTPTVLVLGGNVGKSKNAWPGNRRAGAAERP